MEGNRRIWYKILTVLSGMICMSGCIYDELSEDSVEVDIRISASGMNSKAIMPDEDMIRDVSLMIFDENGMPIGSSYTSGNQQPGRFCLNKGAKYSILACANFGYETFINNITDIRDLDFHLAYPDEYSKGIPMSAYAEDIIIQDDSVIELELERMMARISIRMDRSKLDKDVKMDVIGLRIGNCPKKMHTFLPSKINSVDECFTVGFIHDDIGCSPLNRQDTTGLSEEVSVYMLENLQGKFSTNDILYENEKVFTENDPRRDICSYIELELEYTSEKLVSKEKPLIYRFYLGEDLNSLDIERNCHYHITVCPEEDGLHGDGWRVDKSGIGNLDAPALRQYPDDYIIGNIGDRIHIGCIVTPSDTPFDIGLEYLEADKANGIYDYEIDDDRHGVTLTLTGPGRGLIYMEAGEPVNDAALFLIEVNHP